MANTNHSVSAGWPGCIMVSKTNHFQFQQAGLVLFLWQRLILELLKFLNRMMAPDGDGTACGALVDVYSI